MLRKDSWKRLGLFVILIACMLVAIRLGQRIFFEFQGVYDPDTEIFLALGRGILNGLTPYRDLFETKPPGVFLLSALSITLTDGAMLYKIAQAILFAMLPVAVTLFAFRESKRSVDRAAAFLFSGLLTLYTAYGAGLGYPEGFGAVLGSCAVLVFAFELRRGRSWWSLALLSLSLTASVGIKEPFLLSIVAGFLILAPDTLTVLRRLWAPLVIVAIAGVCILAVTGILGAYTFEYLPHMLFHHGDVASFAPLWMRVLNLLQTARSLSGFSMAFAFSIALLWIGALALVLSTSASRTKRMEAVIRWIVASLLTSLAIAFGGSFYVHHFMFAVPFYVSLGVVWFRAAHSSENRVVQIASVVLLCLLCLASVFHTTPNYSQGVTQLQEREHKARQVASVMDEVMDRCNIDRYLHLIERESGLYGYTRHSPLGPLFLFYLRFLGGNPRYVEALQSQLKTDAQIAIAIDEEASPLAGPSWEFFRSQFTSEPPLCAGQIADIAPYTLYFRR